MYTSQIIIQQYNYTKNLNTYDTELTAMCSDEFPFCQLGTKFYVTLLTYLKPRMNEITVDHQHLMCLAYTWKSFHKNRNIID
jgi:hypothetical protein